MAIRRVLTLTLLAATLGAAPFAVAQEKGSSDEIEQLKEGQEQLRKEMAAIRADLQKVLREIKGLKTAKARAKKPRRRKPDTTKYNVDISDSPVWGPQDAPVTIVEFSDFQCPFCIREVPTLKKIREEYPDDVKVVFKHFPLSFHKNAPPAHAAAELARQEGGSEKFWQMHDKIIANPKKLSKQQLRKYAEDLGLDLGKFDEIIGDKAKMAALYIDDMREARKCNVRGTPTILINGVKLARRNYSGYKARIEEILKNEGGKQEGTQ